MDSIKNIKAALQDKCVDFAELRIANIQQAIDNASESGNDETKSSAGDKHETGRAMMQLEQEKNTTQLAEAIKMREQISKVIWDKKFAKIASGSLVITNKGRFYIAISAGKVMVEGKDYYAISPLAPLSLKLLGLSPKEEVDFNGQHYMVEAIY